ncbi:PepSY-associated TM helix domain-containing protein [Qipengyuania sp. NPDC077410]|uniref:PepSY-associated TM helix domain-containing protein n=1 Tax=Qipengyuania sp. NPDC077410 TaxID=3364496 RepID=UPI0037C89FB3
MKVRTDIVRMYKEIHGWVGIVSGLALFIAFYAGAITMFEEPLQRWASPQSQLSEPVPLERTPQLVKAVLAEYPEAARSYDIHLATGPENPARMSWTVRGGDHAEPEIFYAALAPDGSVEIEQKGPSPVAQFVDVLHQQVGLPFEHEIAMPIMGAISLLYFIALVSGIIVLLPSLVSDFFALRIGKNVKRMWLDVHNVLGILSVPFHIVMALTAVVFAFHDQFYDLQGATYMERSPPIEATAPPPEVGVQPLSPAELARRAQIQAPGFAVRSINFHREEDGSTHARVSGTDPRYGHRAPTYGMVELDAYTGEFTEVDYMPGKQDAWGATITSFFALHFGNFGGTGVRWAYFLLGLAGAFLFYTGNLLWIESRRKRERKNGQVTQTRATRVLAALTVGVPLGCVAGISATIAAAKPLGLAAEPHIHSMIYYAVFFTFSGWALFRGGARAAIELLPVTALSFLTVPAASMLFAAGFSNSVWLVDMLAVIGVLGTCVMWVSARKRAGALPRDSVWFLNGADGGSPQLANSEVR